MQSHSGIWGKAGDAGLERTMDISEWGSLMSPHGRKCDLMVIKKIVKGEANISPSQN